MAVHVGSTLGVENERHNKTVQTKNLGENEDQNHADEKLQPVRVEATRRRRWSEQRTTKA